MKKNETVFFGICVAFFGFMTYQAVTLLGQGRAGEIGSGLWPLLASGISTLLSVVLLLNSLRKPSREKEARETPNPETETEQRRRITVALGVVCLLGYIVLIPVIGFILATLLFIPAFALALGERRKAILWISPFLLTAIIVAVFAKFITIPFPRGIGFFAAFSRLFY